MTTEPIYSKEWINLNEADTKVRVSQFYLRKTNDLFEQILLALNDDAAEQATALRFLRNEYPSASELEILAPVIIDIAVNRNTDNSVLARECLVNSAFSEDRTIREKLTFMFDDLLKSENQCIYRRLAKLLFFLDYKDLRKKLMEKCKNSKDKDIVNIYTEFTEKYDF